MVPIFKFTMALDAVDLDFFYVFFVRIILKSLDSSSSSSKFIKSPASGSSDLIYNNWKSNKNDL